jgi:hypothetical protein
VCKRPESSGLAAKSKSDCRGCRRILNFLIELRRWVLHFEPVRSLRRTGSLTVNGGSLTVTANRTLMSPPAPPHCTFLCIFLHEMVSKPRCSSWVAMRRRNSCARRTFCNHVRTRRHVHTSPTVPPPLLAECETRLEYTLNNSETVSQARNIHEKSLRPSKIYFSESAVRWSTHGFFRFLELKYAKHTRLRERTGVKVKNQGLIHVSTRE